MPVQSYRDDGVRTKSSEEQEKTEQMVANSRGDGGGNDFLSLLKRQSMHEAKLVTWLKNCLSSLSTSWTTLDSSRCWLCYWLIHSLRLLRVPISTTLANQVAHFLGRCQSADGGFGGGPGQLAHVASTYAAVNALCSLGTDLAYSVIDRDGLVKFFGRLKRPDGSFMVTDDGEVDIRAAYCIASCCFLLQLEFDSLFERTAEWLALCQTYEGGFGAYPGAEAHGGYTFCGLAALTLLKKMHLCDVLATLRWLSNRQMSFEGGFQGRTNKLVDGCYSFWQGACFAICDVSLQKDLLAAGFTELPDDAIWQATFHPEALAHYVLLSHCPKTGSFLDKPTSRPDPYHTCYAMSGLSIAAHFTNHRIPFKAAAAQSGDHSESNDQPDDSATSNIGSNPSIPSLAKVHPLYNIVESCYVKTVQYFEQSKSPPASGVHYEQIDEQVA